MTYNAYNAYWAPMEYHKIHVGLGFWMVVGVRHQRTDRKWTGYRTGQPQRIMRGDIIDTQRVWGEKRASALVSEMQEANDSHAPTGQEPQYAEPMRGFVSEAGPELVAFLGGERIERGQG